MSFHPGDRVFVDESKARGYYLVAAASAVSSLHDSEKALRRLLKPGQRRIHFKSERDGRRREILSAMTALEVRGAVWVVKGRPDKEARPRCLEALTETALRDGVDQLIIERDESLQRADRSTIAEMLRRGEGASLQYGHASPHEHPLLWVSDAVAWC